MYAHQVVSLLKQGKIIIENDCLYDFVNQQWLNNHELPTLRKILAEAFPGDDDIPMGNARYYFKEPEADVWTTGDSVDIMLISAIKVRLSEITYKLKSTEFTYIEYPTYRQMFVN